jgi:aminoglycoside/choline kinase family phosphotransferase
MPYLAEIVELTRFHFPHFGNAPITAEPLEKGGSDRKFYRLRSPGIQPLIYVQYGQQKEENRHYVEIAEFLERAGVRVPRMYLHEAMYGRIWMEDLGESDLWSFRNEPWSVRRSLYEAALKEALRLHTCAQDFLPPVEDALGLQPPFDEKLYLWEQDYFLQNCLGRHFGKPADVLAPSREALSSLAVELSHMPRVLVHRDFQSQNIVVNEGVPCLIDFQGMRFGLPQYDLASLLLDPYVDLTPDEREELLEFYCDRWTAQEGSAGGGPAPDFRRVYALCAAQRLMQALGAYGFLGHEKGREEFLAHIPVALVRLLDVIRVIPELSALEQIVASVVGDCSESLI